MSLLQFMRFQMNGPGLVTYCFENFFIDCNNIILLITFIDCIDFIDYIIFYWFTDYIKLLIIITIVIAFIDHIFLLITL